MVALRAGLPVKKHNTFWSTAGARPTIPTIHGMVMEEVRPIFEPHLTFLIRSVVSPLGAIKNLSYNAPTAGKCLKFGCLYPESNQSKNLKSTWRRVQNLRIS